MPLAHSSEHSLVGVVLAAGFGRRIGRPKALLELDGQPFYKVILEGMERAGIKRRILIVGPWWDAKVPVADAVVLVNQDPDTLGPIGSIRLALDKIEDEASGILVALVDHPMVRPSTYEGLVKAHIQHKDAIIVPGFGPKKMRGHPVVFPSWTFQYLRGEEATGEGARAVLRTFPDKVMEISVEDPGILIDIDTDSDYHRVEQFVRSAGEGLRKE